MMTETEPLQDLAHQINQQVAHLAQLREEFSTRQRQLKELNRQKQDLQKQLENVEAKILGVSQMNAPTANGSVSSVPMRAAQEDANGVSLPKFLVSLVHEANGPITVKEISEELIRRKFKTKSKNLAAMVETRVSELVRNGLLKRTADKGLLPGTGSASKVAVKSSMPKAAKPLTPVKMSGQAKNMTLKEMISHTLAQSSRPLTTSELAELILKTGYVTKSKDFKNVIWVGIGSMTNVERLPGVGYRLKKGYANKK